MIDQSYDHRADPIGQSKPDPAIAGIDLLVRQVEEGVKIIETLTDRLLAVEKRLAELEDHVGRITKP